MKQTIIALAFTITFPQVVVAQEIEITDTFNDADLTQLKLNICNSEVNAILSTNQLDETHRNDPSLSFGQYTVVNNSYDDDYIINSTDNKVVSVDSAENIVASICS